MSSQEPEHDTPKASDIEQDVEPVFSADKLSEAFANLLEEDITEEEFDDSVEDAEDSEEIESEESSDSVVSPESILEAMLFVGHPENQPLTSRLLASFMRGVSPQEIDRLIVELNEKYDEEDEVFHIVSEGPGYRMAIRDKYDSVRQRFYGKIKQAKLSQSAIDVLAVVAYKQPIDKKAVDKLRGSNSGALLNQLVRRDLLKAERTTEKPKRTIYQTTERFLDFFHIEHLDDLPQVDE